MCHTHSSQPPPPNLPWARETKPFDGGRNKSNASLSPSQTLDWNPYWNYLQWRPLEAISPAQTPFSPSKLRREFPSGEQERRGRKLDSLSVEALFSLISWVATVWKICLHDVFMKRRRSQTFSLGSTNCFAQWEFELSLKSRILMRCNSETITNWSGLWNLEGGQSRCSIRAVMGLVWRLKQMATLIITLLFSDQCCVRAQADGSHPADGVDVWVGHWAHLAQAQTVWTFAHSNYKRAYFHGSLIRGF